MKATKAEPKASETDKAIANLPEEERSAFPASIQDMSVRRPPPPPLARPFVMREYQAHNGDGGRPATTWRNPLFVPQRLELRYEVTAPSGARIDVIRLVEIPPGGTVQLPAVFDLAIKVVHNGVAIGGLAPALESLSHAPVPLHDALLEGVEPLMNGGSA